MATAKEASVEETSGEDFKPRRAGFGGKLKKLLIIAVVLTLIGAGATVWLLLQKKNELATEGGEDITTSAPFAPDMSKPPTFVALEPFTVNLQREDGERYLQVIMALRVDSAKTGDNLKNFMPAIRHRINLRLTGKLPSEISTPEGQEQLAQELATDANAALGSPLTGGEGAPVHSVLFNSIIIQ